MCVVCLFVLYISFVKENQEALRAQHSSLEFKLHRLQFIRLIQQGIDKQQEALLYAKNFSPFAHSHSKGNA